MSPTLKLQGYLNLVYTRSWSAQQLLASKSGQAQPRRTGMETREKRRRDSDRRCVPEDRRIEGTDPVDARALLEQDLTPCVPYELQADSVGRFARRNDVVADCRSRNQHKRVARASICNTCQSLR